MWSTLEVKRFIEIVSYHNTFSDNTVSYHGASIEIPDDTPKSTCTIAKENHSFNIFQDHFYNKLQRSKILLKYNDHLYDK